MNINDKISNILNNNKELETIVELEKQKEKNEEMRKEAQSKNDINALRRIKEEKIIIDLRLEQLKESLNDEELKLFEYIKIYLEFNSYTESIRKIEKSSKKSNDVVLTTNSEGRKKEIDSALLSYYNYCTSKKNEITKQYLKILYILENYEINTPVIPKISKTYDKTDLMSKIDSARYASLKATVEETTKKVEIKNEESKENNEKKNSLLSKVKKIFIGAALGVATFASVLSIGHGKIKETKKVTNIEKDINKVEDEKEAIVLENHEQHTQDTYYDSKIQNLGESAEEIKTIEMTIGDKLEVSSISKIMSDEYDATYYQNGKNPYYDCNEYREVQGVVYEFPNGEIVVARNEEEVDYCESIIGANKTAFLSVSQYGIEGFYSAQDIIIENESRELSKKRSR